MPRLDPVFVRAQIDLLRVRCPEIDSDDETLRVDMLEAETDFHRFLDAVIDRKQDAEEMVEGIGRLIENNKARKARYERIAEAMRDTAHKIMDHAGVRKFVLPRATVWISAGQPKVIVTDEDALPADCVRIKRAPDITAIKDHLKRGEPVPGVELSNAEPHLNVRDK
jgi:predicted ribosome quality control (RQC) complex YloA/Tae2 family protein